MTRINRRAFVAGIAAAGFGLSGMAHAELHTVIDPWGARDMTMSDTIRLQEFAGRLRRHLGELPIETRVLEDHVRVRIPADFAFEAGKDALTPEGVAALTLIAERVLAQPRINVEIAAHHDARPSDYAAYVFTQRRAMAVQSTFLSRQVPASRMKMSALGLKFPFTDPTSPENQRIELIIRTIPKAV